MMSFNVPKREYCDGEKRIISMRLPVKLVRELEKWAHNNGYSTTDIVSIVMDQFLQSQKSSEKKGGKI
jgi:hypothetical protein